MTTEAEVIAGQGKAGKVGDFRMLGPWFFAVLLNSYASTLYAAGCYDFADKALGASAAMRLWMSAAWGLGYIFISLMAGRVVQKWGSRRALFLMSPLSIAASLVGLVILRVDSGWAGAPWILVGLMLPFNVANSACWPALESAISRSSGQMRLSVRMAVYNLSWAGAGFVAFFTRGALEELGWWTIFAVPAITLAVSLAVLAGFAISRERAEKEVAAEESLADTPAVRQRAVVLLHMAWVGNALAYVAINVITPVLMKMADEAGIGSRQLALAGILTSVWGFTRVAGFLGVGKWTGWHYKARWLVGSQFALAGTFLLMMVVHNIWVLLLAQIVFGLATALIYSSSLYYAMHTSEGSGGHAGFHEALIGVGIFVGPAIGAIAGGDTVGTDALGRIGWSVMGVLVLGACVMAWMGRRRAAGPVHIPENLGG